MSKPHFSEKELEGLSPKEREMLAKAIDLVIKKRRIMAIGYLMAALTILAGGVVAMVAYLWREPGSFWMWTLLLPFAGCGASLWVFGKLAKRAGKKRYDARP